MQVRQFRLHANTLPEAVEKAHEKCPEMISTLKIWLIYGDWWECQAQIKTEQVIPAPSG